VSNTPYDDIVLTDTALSVSGSTATSVPPDVAAIRPPLKWAGGKRWLLPHVLPFWSKHRERRMVEPFAGGLAITLGLLPERALLNDVNPHLINFYRWLKKGLVTKLKCENKEAAFYKHRERFNSLLQSGKAETAEAAALFYYLNRTGYNGLCRFNASGGFNVPFGRYASISYKTDFLEYRSVFARWEFTSANFRDLMLDEGDFVYADPPYDVQFTQYSKGGFDWNDQVATAEWLASHRGPVVLSNQATGRIVDLYQALGFELTLLSAPRRISCSGDRSPAAEVLATKNV
jgi:DNA adenine methylase